MNLMNLQNIVIEFVVVLLTTLGSWVLIKIKTLVNTKIKNEKARKLLDAATMTVASSVKATFQTYVEGIKGTSAWTQDTQIAALRKAADTAKAQMSAEVRAYIVQNFGDLSAWIENAIEAEIYSLKNTAPATAAEVAE